ncbi:hypothetical protein KC349_g1269 [Hortaea werneckii]|nr:hypothetical protein KC349_g1269 [Hortaea werneckii]
MTRRGDPVDVLSAIKAWSRNYEAEETSNRYRRELHGAIPQEYQQTEWEESLMSLLKDYCESPNEHSSGDAQAIIAPLCHSLLGYDPFKALEKEEQNADNAARDAEIARTEASEAVDRANKTKDELERMKAHVIAVEASNRRKADRYQVEVRRVQEITNARDKALKDKEQAVSEAGELRSLYNEAVTDRSAAREEMFKARDEGVKSEHAAKISAARAKEARSQVQDAQKQSHDAHSAAQDLKAAGLQMKREISELEGKLRQLSVMYGKLRVANSRAQDDLRSQIQDHMQPELLNFRQQNQIDSLQRMLRSAHVEIEDWCSEEQFAGLEAFSVDRKLSELERELSRTNQLLLEAEQRNRTDALENATKKSGYLQEKCDQQTEECQRRLQAESIARREIEEKLGAVQEELNNESATLSQERERLDQTRNDLNAKTEENTELRLEFSRQIEAREDRANSLGS